MIGFGLDLAGYSTGKTRLAAIETSGSTAYATLLSDSVFAGSYDGSQPLEPIRRREISVVCKCLTLGILAVDVPIDLQGLLAPANAKKISDLTRRPIDQIHGALPPLADKLGAVVARFRSIMEASGLDHQLGHRLFETYPAASFRNLGIDIKKKANLPVVESACKKLHFEFEVSDGLNFTDDDMDAIVCAATSLAVMTNTAWIAETPRGYALLESWPFDRVVVSRSPFDNFVPGHNHQ
jgi:hypothetical protein